MKKNGGGFTILETMIVMTVSATMLASAILLFSGQQRRTQFSQSLRDIESKIQDVLNDVATGYFPNAGNISCSASGANEPAINASGTSEQGANFECVFMGKALLFRPDGFVIYPIVGSRGLASSASASDPLSTVKPILATTLQEQKSFLWGARIYAVYWNDTTLRNADGGMIAVASTPNGTGVSSDGGFNSGLQRLNMYSSGTAVGTSVNITEPNATNSEIAIKSALTNPLLSWVPDDKVVLCIEDDSSGSGRQFGGIVITGRSAGAEARIQLAGDGPQCV